MYVTERALRNRGACDAGVSQFSRVFPNGVRVTIRAAVENADRLNWSWAATYLVPGDYDRNWQRFKELTTAANDEYHRAMSEMIRTRHRTGDLCKRVLKPCAKCVAYYDAYERYLRRRAEVVARLIRDPKLRELNTPFPGFTPKSDDDVAHVEVKNAS